METRAAASPSTVSWRMIASWAIPLRRKPASPASVRYAWIANSALRMSHRCAESRESGGCIQNLTVCQDVTASVWIDDELFPHQIDITTEQRLQLFNHLHPVEERMVGIRSELHQHVHVAVGAKVVAQDGAEEREFADLPLAAERLDLLLRDFDVHADLRKGWIPKITRRPRAAQCRYAGARRRVVPAEVAVTARGTGR